MEKLTLTVFTVVFGLLLSMPVLAHRLGRDCDPVEGRGPGVGMGHSFHDSLWVKLNLSAEQKAKIDAIELVHRKEVMPIKEKMFDKSVAFRRMWLLTNPDKDKIIALQKALRILRHQLEDKTTVHRLEICKVLTPEQRDKLVNSGCGKGIGFGPHGGMRGHNGVHEPGMCN
jgi:Spy/CpxP family protein refolding chaperone